MSCEQGCRLPTQPFDNGNTTRTDTAFSRCVRPRPERRSTCQGPRSRRATVDAVRLRLSPLRHTHLHTQPASLFPSASTATAQRYPVWLPGSLVGHLTSNTPLVLFFWFFFFLFLFLVLLICFRGLDLPPFPPPTWPHNEVRRVIEPLVEALRDMAN